MRVPFSLLKGSGSMELDVGEPGLGTAQSAPSSSPPACTCAATTCPSAAPACAVSEGVIRLAAATRAAAAHTRGRYRYRWKRIGDLQRKVRDRWGTDPARLA
ncbi:hypothetical protein TNCT6_65800 [Streptomyces sp. 6-11-2]|nr:hypothetical protein TNCT6_65800 [Streptomyces sp. 6-11-2]